MKHIGCTGLDTDLRFLLAKHGILPRQRYSVHLQVLEGCLQALLCDTVSVLSLPPTSDGQIERAIVLERACSRILCVLLRVNGM